MALGDRITQEAHEVSSILFGSAVVVKSSDVFLLAALLMVVAALTLTTWRGIAFASFDPEGARVQGLPVRALDLGFWALVAITVSVTTRVLGALPPETVIGAYQRSAACTARRACKNSNRLPSCG